jgi:hypothetical protein
VSASRLAQRALVRLALLGLAPRRPLRVVTSADEPSGAEDELVTLPGGSDAAARASALLRARGERAYAVAIAVSSETATAIALLAGAPEPAPGAPEGWRAALAWARAAGPEPEAPPLDAKHLEDAAAALAELGFACVEPDAARLVPGLGSLGAWIERPLDRVIWQVHVLGERHRPVLFVRTAAARRARSRAESLGEPWAAPRVTAPPGSSDAAAAIGPIALELCAHAAAPLAFKDLLRAARELAQERDASFRVSRDEADVVRRALTRAYFSGTVELFALAPDASHSANLG